MEQMDESEENGEGSAENYLEENEESEDDKAHEVKRRSSSCQMVIGSQFE